MRCTFEILCLMVLRVRVKYIPLSLSRDKIRYFDCSLNFKNCLSDFEMGSHFFTYIHLVFMTVI